LVFRVFELCLGWFFEVDPAIHNSNTSVFGGRVIGLDRCDHVSSDRALEAVRQFLADHGSIPTAASWAAAGMSPSEKTIRRRFGSFRAAAL
jgi:hypothetical protein